MIQAQHLNGFAIRLRKSYIHLMIWTRHLKQIRMR